MKRYLVSFFVSLFLAFFFILLILSVVALPYFTSSNSYVTVAQKYSLGEKVYDEINMHFVDLSGSSNIPASVFEGTVSKSAVEGVIPKYTKSIMDYTFNKTDEIYDIELDLGAVESAISEYFETFANENNIERDDAFYNQRNLTISEVKDAVNEYAKMSVLKKAANILRPYTAKVTAYGVIAIGVLLLLCLVFVYALMRIDFHRFIYWVGISLGCACLLLLIVFGGMRVFGFFDGFILSEIVVKTIVTGLLKGFCDIIAIVSAVILAAVSGGIYFFFSKKACNV